VSLPALYELAGTYRTALAALAENEDLPPDLIRDTLDGLVGDIEVKATNVAKFVLGLEAESEAMEVAAAAMKERAARRKRRADGIRNYLLLNMQLSQIKKIECPEFTLAVRANPPAVEIDSLAVIPPEYMVTPEPPPPRPDKKLLAQALKGGATIPGVWLKTGEHLSIKA